MRPDSQDQPSSSHSDIVLQRGDATARVYQTRSGQWAWDLFDAQGVVGVGGEYSNLADAAERALDKLLAETEAQGAATKSEQPRPRPTRGDLIRAITEINAIVRRRTKTISAISCVAGRAAKAAESTADAATRSLLADLAETLFALDLDFYGLSCSVEGEAERFNIPTFR